MTNRLNQLHLFLEETPNSPFILFALAKEYEKLDQQRQAEQYFKRLVEQHPEYVGTYYHYGQWLEEQDQTDAALDIYTRGIEVATQAGDQHARSELMNARMNLEVSNY